MKSKFPLLAKMVVWLLIHFAVLAGAFAIFVNWQLQLGLDSVLSGASGDRLKTLGNAITSDLKATSREDWPAIVSRHVEPYGLDSMLVLSRGREVVGEQLEIPADVGKRLEDGGGRGPRPRPGLAPPDDDGPPGREGRSGPPPMDRGGPREDPRFDGPPASRPPRGGPPGGPSLRQEREGSQGPEVRPLFLSRSEDDGYWAAVDLPLFSPSLESPLHGMLILRSNNASAGGLFFDLQLWILGGLSVLFLSLLIWAPFIIGITRYVTRLSRATERIARGKFDVRIKGFRRDELGSLGESIEEMSQQIDRLVSGQKRFLGDVAHELCSPLARIRTGLGVMEHGLGESHRSRLDSIEEDVSELSDLVSELLDFTKASTAPNSVTLESIELLPLLEEQLEHQCPNHEVEWRVEPGILVLADRRLLTRAVANVLRNAHRHAGADCELHLYAKPEGDAVELMIADNGPGVAPGVSSRLFEPFYRPDEARIREAGGVGLGLAIVHSAIEACDGTVTAKRVNPHGLAILMRLKPALT